MLQMLYGCNSVSLQPQNKLNEKTMKKRTLICGVLAMMMSSASALEKQVASPDGKLVVTVNDNDGKPSYQVTLDGKVFLETSALGLNTNIGDFTQGMTMSVASEMQTVSDSYQLDRIKKSHVEYHANKQVLTFSKDDKKVYDIVFQVSDNDIAFRYKLYPQGDTRCLVVKQEATSYQMPKEATSFLCPQMNPMTGFARTAPSYETNYDLDVPVGTKLNQTGYTFPCLFKNGNNGWVLLSETGTDAGYVACRLMGKADGSYQIGNPMPEEMNGQGSANPALNLPGETPWRTITVGKTLAPIVETTIPFDVVAPKYKASKQYEYGKGTWSWIIGMDWSCNFDEQKRYIDFAAAMGYQTVLVDALWDTQIGYPKMEELAKYGKSKGVDLFLWYNSNGSWNDAPQGPRGIMDNTLKRREEMAWMQKNGIRGIKVDFFGGDKQEMMKLYEDILIDANDHGIEVIFHGCTLPRGWERMYPNYVASEAVLASENLHFSQGMCDAEAKNACIHPFVRNAVGSMDFGGSTFNKYYNGDNKTGSHRVTSDVFALATAVLFQSSVQHFALAPNNLTDAPAWAIDFMKQVPTTWDDTRFIDGYPGKYVIMARRHGDKWYVVGVNAEKQPLKKRITLDMLKPGSIVNVYSDDARLVGSKKQVKLGKKQTLDVVIPCNGGVVIE